MSIVGALVVVAAAVMLFTDVERLPLLLAAVVPFAATSAVTVAGQSVIPYHLVAILLIATSGGLLLRSYHANLSRLPGARPLLAFGVWAVIVTMVSPRIFAGLKVLDPRRGIDLGVKQPASLEPSISNVAQSGYLVLAVLVVAVIAFHPYPAHRLPALAFGLGTVLNTLKGLLPESLQTQVFDNSSNVTYTAGTFDGVERMRGLFSEPAGLGAFSVAAFIFFAVSAARFTGPVRYLSLLFAGWSFTNAALSYSGGAVVTGVLVALVVFARGAYVVIAGRQKISNLGAAGMVAMLPIAAIAGPPVSDFVNAIVVDKSGSASAANRSAADQFSFGVLGNSSGIGTGLGSNRPSSFVASVLSNVGVFGALLLLVALVLVLGYAFLDVRYQPAVWSAIALMISKAVSGPDVSEPILWFLLAVCAQGAWQRYANAPDEPAPGGAATSSHFRRRFVVLGSRSGLG